MYPRIHFISPLSFSSDSIISLSLYLAEMYLKTKHYIKTIVRVSKSEGCTL